MSSIIKESIGYSAYSLIGLFVSFLSTVFIYPLSLETYGAIQFVVSTSNLILPMVSLAASSLIIYFHKYYENRGRIDELTTILLILSILTTMIFAFGYLFFESVLPVDNIEGVFNFALLHQFGIWIILISGCISIMSISTAILNLKNKIVFPQFFTNLFLKISIGLLVFLAFMEKISLEEGIIYLFVYHVVALIWLWSYQNRFHQYAFKRFTSLTRSKWKELTSYSFYSMLSGLGSSIAFRLDVIFISLIIGVKEAGIYSLFLFMANMIELPSTGYTRIISPKISADIKKNNLLPILKIYQNSSKVLMVLGGFIGLFILSILPSLLSFMKNGLVLKEFLSVWMILALAKWINMFTSVNSQILAYSNYYKYNFLLLFILSIVNVFLNYYLITQYGISGAAIATATTITMYNFGKYLMIRELFKMSPFTMEAIPGLFILVASVVVLALMPSFNNEVLNIVIRVLSVALLFIGGVFYFNISDEIKLFITKNVRWRS